MNWRILSVWLYILSLSTLYGQEKKSYKAITVAFYNLENLFDYENDPFTFDDDRTPEGKDRWTAAHYNKKLIDVSKVLSEVGTDLTGESPLIIGLCEIENQRVLQDLVSQEILKSKNYGIIHFDSPDRRGVDVALLYKKGLFTPITYKAVPLVLYDIENPSKREYTRDQLLVTGLLENERFHIIVNHWPSRRGGEESSRYKRMKAAALNKRIIDSLFSIDPYSKIITMGDLNDDPIDVSLKEVLGTSDNQNEVPLKGLFNPMEGMFNKGLGTLAYRDRWSLFDQIILSRELIGKDFSSYRFYKAGIYNKAYLVQESGPYKGYPFRTYSGSTYQGGFSDHFPVYICLIKEIIP